VATTQTSAPSRRAFQGRAAREPWTYSVSSMRAWIVGSDRGAPSGPTHATWQISASSRIAWIVARS
jgi:hypothetical protein